MATTATELRRELLVSIRDTRTEIDVLLDDTIASVERASRQYANDQRRFERAVLAAIATFWASYRLLSRGSNGAVAASFVEYVNASIGTKLRRVGAAQTYTRLQRRTAAYPSLIERSILSRKSPYDGRSINQRIVTLQRANTQIVEKILKHGIDADLSVNQVARSIQNYVNPNSQAGRRFTRGNGIDYRAVKIGKKLPKGSIRYNAVRIARTEIMTTYDLAAKAYYQDQPWSTGWDWILSNTHSGFDDCDTLANSSPHRTLPDRPHPQCACDARPRVASLAEFERLVQRGVIR